MAIFDRMFKRSIDDMNLPSYFATRKHNISNFKQRRRSCNIIPILATILIGLTLLLVTFYYFMTNLETIPYSHRTHFVPMSRETEKRIGDREFNLFRLRNMGRILPASHPASKRAKFIAGNVVKAMQRGLRDDTFWGGPNRASQYLEHVHWQVFVVDRPIKNAHCFPGGQIVLYTGLLKYHKADAQIAFIIGHEVAHSLARHASEMSFKEHLGEFLRLFFLRQLEFEADHIGLLLMASAGYDPYVVLRTMEWEALMKEADDHSLWATLEKEAMEYAHTHPSLMKRAKFIDQAEEEAFDLYLKRYPKS